MKYLITVLIILIACSFTIKEPDWLEHPRVEQWNSRINVSVSNSHNTELKHVPVTVPIADLQISEDDLSPGNFYVYSHEDKTTPLFQVDVPENKEINEIVFLVDLEPGETKDYYIYYAENGQAWPKQERFTQATDMPGWESELFGYRSYGPFALDLFARDKDRQELMLHRFYNENHSQIYNYHESGEFGLDILHLGSTSGLAGVGLYNGAKTTLVGAPFSSEVIVSGPVRSIVEMKMKDWQSEFGTISITRQATIYAHHYETMIEDWITGADEGVKYSVGIRKVKKNITDFNQNQGLFLQWQNQGNDIGDAGIGLYINSEDIERVIEDEENTFVLSSLPNKVPFRFWAFGAWERGEGINDISTFKDRAERIKKLQMPIQVTVGDLQHPSGSN